MRRRIVLAVLGTVIAALVLAGAGTLVLSWGGQQQRELAELSGRAEAIAGTAAELLPEADETPDGTGPGLTRSQLGRIRAAFEVQEIDLTVLRPAGAGEVQAPDGVDWSPAEVAQLRDGGTVTGRTEQRELFASAGSNNGRATVVATLVSTSPGTLGRTARWFLLASAAVVLVAGLVALRLGSRLSRPVSEATDVTRRIAAGDLAARLDEPADDDEGETAVLARSVNAMADALERSRGIERQFLMSVSHDLRTPLTSIRGYAEAITDGATDDPRHAAAVISAEATRMERLVQDLLDLARLDAHQFTMHPVTVPLDEVVQRAVDGLRQDVTHHGLSLMVHPGSGSQVLVDPDRLVQALGNLVANATRFARSRIDVTVRDDPGEVTVTVADDGPGIPADELPHVVERLYRSRQRPLRQGPGTGTGLGLAIVSELVAAMGGHMGVHSPAGGGTAVWVTLPTVTG